MTWLTWRRMSTRFGLPTMAGTDHSILEALANKPAWLPDVMHHQLHIAYQGSRLCNVLGNCEMTADGLLPNPAPIIQMFDTELRAQEARFASCWRNNEYIFFLATKLQLYSFALSTTGLELTNSAERRTEIYSHAYLTAMNLLQSALDLSTELPYWSEHQLRNVIDAVYFLLKLGGASYEFVDEAAAKNTVGQVWQLLRSRSQTEDDHVSRVCSVIEYLSQNPWKRESNVSVKIKSRMAGNLAIDSVWCARNRFSETVRAQRPVDYTSAAGIEKSLDGLDEQPWLSFFGEVVGDWECIFEKMNVESLLGSMDGG
ncbi:Transcriptional regulatory protein LEU3 [Penicillium angulare]|uniref:Transcriptional regulatory protein LEU3 n=1 Tax=Penicillium angulare TaxID=116970 RepID=UPI0025423D9A|nr:Transcriptional regulatory protein LEU3 [Penicillium angulare]KAJ5261282.1 Transcriptional regulatory protein LEU3 [Penicillium angulare]